MIRAASTSAQIVLAFAVVAFAGCSATQNEPEVTAVCDHQVAVAVMADSDPWQGPAPLRVRFSVDELFHDVRSPRYEWDFGDGSPKSIERSPAHTYKRPGRYKAILVVTDGVCPVSDTDDVDITVDDPK